jgi:hypothetical protein
VLAVPTVLDTWPVPAKRRKKDISALVDMAIIGGFPVYGKQPLFPCLARLATCDYFKNSMCRKI